MILLWGLMEDEPMGMAHAALTKAGADFFFLDHRKVFTSEIEYAYDAGTVDRGGVRAAYLRGYNFLDFEEMRDRPRDDPLAVKAMGFQLQLMAFLDASGCLVDRKSEIGRA